MNYHNITTNDMLNGTGLRTVLWVSGCTHHCVGCHNSVTWDFNDGIPFTSETVDELVSSLQEDWCSGLTLSGGDPLHPENLPQITGLCTFLKAKFPEKTIWCYTGYLWEEICDCVVLQYIDVLVDGEFQIDKLDVNYAWAGSTNQRVIDVKASLELGSVVRYEA